MKEHLWVTALGNSTTDAAFGNLADLMTTYTKILVCGNCTAIKLEIKNPDSEVYLKGSRYCEGAE
jgi:hypothetical protein